MILYLQINRLEHLTMRPVTMRVDQQSGPKPGPNRDQNRDRNFFENRDGFHLECECSLPSNFVQSLS